MRNTASRSALITEPPAQATCTMGARNRAGAVSIDTPTCFHARQQFRIIDLQLFAKGECNIIKAGFVAQFCEKLRVFTTEVGLLHRLFAVSENTVRHRL